MRKQSYAVAPLLGLLALLAGCAGTAGQAPAEPAAVAAATPIEVKARHTSGPVSVAADQAKLVFVEFVASPALTAELRQALAAAGYQVADSREQATVIYELDGAFQALRPATNRMAEIRAGEFAEKPGPVATKSGRGTSFVLSANPIAMVLGTVLSNVGTRSGARDATNQATVGDPDGKCLSKCEGWLYRQRAAINLTRTEAGVKTISSAMASVTAPRLQAGELFARSYAEVAGATGMPQPARIATFAQADQAKAD